MSTSNSKPIWRQQPTLSSFKAVTDNTLVAHLSIEITEIGDDYLTGRMPVDHRTHQPMGILHGGANVALAETLASFCANMVIDTSKTYAVGVEINANHIRSVRSGHVTGTARPIHLGRTTHVWEVRIVDERGKLTCISRMTAGILER